MSAEGSRPSRRFGRREYPIGAEPMGGEGTHVRVWAPARKRVEVVLDGDRGPAVSLAAEPGGYHAGLVPGLHAGGRYGFRLDGERKILPDPASRFQPDGPHGLSEVVDPRRFAWTDGDWRGVSRNGQVIYELHVGTFTPDGTYLAAIERLPGLRDLGITVVELMPLNEFPGRYGWGYDGVDLWAPTRLYGSPDDLRRLVDAAHEIGLGVLLDVVYNHIGPDGNYLRQFSQAYFTDRHKSDWGEGLNYDGDDAGPVREFFVQNARYWIDEYHFDGLRLDATQSIVDCSERHVLAEIGEAVREGGRGRATYVAAENEPQAARLVRPVEGGGYALDSLWNDDFHHSARVALTGKAEAYYMDYAGAPQELLSALRWGYLYQGQRYRWQNQPRGESALDLPAESFVSYLENHDQVSNSGSGQRLASLVDAGRLRAMTALWLLAPATPMFFQGQEFGSTRPFVFFADHHPELAAAVSKGRREFLAQFPSLASPAAAAQIPDPSAEATFLGCKIDWAERSANGAWLRLHQDLLRLRKTDPAFSQQRSDQVFGTVLGADLFALRFRAAAGDRLVLVNLGSDRHLEILPEPLLAPPTRAGWTLLWSSEDPSYGGEGVAQVVVDDGWRVSGHATVVLG